VFCARPEPDRLMTRLDIETALSISNMGIIWHYRLASCMSICCGHTADATTSIVYCSSKYFLLAAPATSV